MFEAGEIALSHKLNCPIPSDIGSEDGLTGEILGSGYSASILDTLQFTVA